MSIKCPNCQTENVDDTFFCSHCAAPLISPEDAKGFPHPIQNSQEELGRGAVFAQRYEVIEELGKGGMGRVYRVLDSKINEEVALKLLRSEVVKDEKTINRFSNELKLARKVTHKYICRMYHLSEESDTHYITMEYVQGESLKNMIKMTKQLSTHTALHIARQVAEGLAEAHRMGVVHRDLKPGNIMIDRDGDVKIMDFGIACSLEPKKETGFGSMIGTAQYISPEQVDGKNVDARADIYSLGVILFEMLTGRLPFEGESTLSVALKHKNERPPDPRELNAHIPTEISRMILRCLEKEKVHRFDSAEALAAELRSVERSLPTSEYIAPPEKSATTQKISDVLQHRGLWIAATALIVLGLVIGLFSIKRREPSPAITRKMLAVLPFINLGQPEDEYFADGLTEEITSRLSALHGLGVISRTNTKQYKNTEKTSRQIGRELGVDYILEGTIHWNRGEEGQDRVLVIPQLIRAEDDTQLWSERYDRVIGDIFSLQSEIAEKVILKLDLTVLEPERQALMAKPTNNLRAYDFYWQGRQQAGVAWNTSDLQDYELAVDLLSRAVELDPDFAFAYITLSITHQWAYANGVDRTEERLIKARDAIYRALEIDPELPDAQLALGFYYYRGYQDYDRALEIFESVHKARPNLPYTYLGYILRRLGRWSESTKILEDSFKLSPLNADLAYQIGRSYACLCQYDEADHWFDRAVSIDSNYYFPLLAKSRIPVLARGNKEEARILLEKLPEHRLTDYTWYTHGMLEGAFAQVAERLMDLPYEAFIGNSFYIPIDLALASAYFGLGERESTRKHADLARLSLEEAAGNNPQDPRFHASLGLAYAYLGQQVEARREGNLALEIFPVSKDSFDGPRYVLDMAVICTLVGDFEGAIDQLEYLLSIEAGTTLSAALVRIDPIWDPLRAIPRFLRLLNSGD